MSSTNPFRCRLFIESDHREPQILDCDTGSVYALCRSCPGRVDPNDDSAGVVQTEHGGVVLIVADGMGSGPVGHKASAIAVNSIAESVLSAPGKELRPAILDGIESANRDILELGIGAATTLAVVEIQDKVARGYQVGDSQAVIVGQRGVVKWKSTPHSPVGYAVESGLLDEADAILHEDRHYVSNVVGSRAMHIEIGPAQTLSPRDTVIVGSDGLFDNLHFDEVVQLGRKGKPIDRINAMTDLATTRMEKNDVAQPGKPDDLTVLIYLP